jgi:hypothetical protein
MHEFSESFAKNSKVLPEDRWLPSFANYGVFSRPSTGDWSRSIVDDTPGRPFTAPHEMKERMWSAEETNKRSATATGTRDLKSVGGMRVSTASVASGASQSQYSRKQLSPDERIRREEQRALMGAIGPLVRGKTKHEARAEFLKYFPNPEKESLFLVARSETLNRKVPLAPNLFSGFSQLKK